MNREIKFRAWSKQEGHQGWCKYWSQSDIIKAVGRSDVDIMQYTGLKDKNGNEIYEGDIIKKDNDWDGVLRVVGYSKYEYVLYEKEQLKSGKRQDGRIFDISSIIGSTQVYGEVVGNIYENSDILSSTQIKNV